MFSVRNKLPVPCVLMLYIPLLLAPMCAAQPEPSVALLLEGIESTMIDDVRNTLNGTNSSSVQVIDVTNKTPFQLFQMACTLASSGTVAMVTQASCTTILTLSSVANSLGMTLIAEESDCEQAALEDVATPSEEEEYILEGDTVLIRAITTPFMDSVLYDILILLEWKDIIIVYEEENHMASYLKDIDSVMDAVNGTTQTLTVRTEHIKNDINNILKYMLDNDKQLQVLVVCGADCLTQLFREARLLDTAGTQQEFFSFAVQWLVLAEQNDMPDILTNVKEINHVTVLTPPIQHDVDLAVVKNLLQVVNVTNILVRDIQDWEWQTHMTTCGTKVSSGRNLGNELETSLMTVIQPDNAVYELFAAIWKSGGERKFELVTEWRSDMITLLDDVFPNIKRGLNGKFIRVGTNTWSPFVIFDANVTHSYKGYCIDLLKMMATQFNFTYELIEPEDREWGVFKNGTYSGLVGQLVRKEVDIVVAPLTKDINRSMYIDFTDPFFVETQTVLVQYPDPTKSNWRIYMDPFQWDVWTGVILAIPTAGIILWAFHRLSPYYDKPDRKKDMGNIQDSLWYSFGSFLTQGTDILPDAQSGRFVVGFWLMYCLVVIASYSGNLVAFFTVSNPTLPFSTLSDMVNSSYKFGTLAGAYNYMYIRDSTSGIFKQISDKLVEFNESDPSVLSYNHNEHIQKVKSDNYAYIVDSTAAQMVTSFSCTLDVIKEVFIPVKYSIALQNNSAYRMTFNRGLDLFAENGLSLRWRQDWWPSMSLCDRGLVTSSKPVSLSDMQGAFFLMAIILGLAMFTLFIELIVRDTKRRAQKDLREAEQQTEQHREVRYYQYENNYGRNEYS